MLTINPKYQPFVEMHPNKPLYLNNKAYRMPLQIVKKKINEFSITSIDYEEDVLRKQLVSRSNKIHEQAMLKLQYDNAILQAQLAKYQNKCQLAENQLMYQCLANKTIEYQQLINKTKELPSLNADYHYRVYSKSLNTREHKQSLNVSQQEGERLIEQEPERKQQTERFQKNSQTLASHNDYQQDGRPPKFRYSQTLKFENKQDIFAKPQTTQVLNDVQNPMRSAESQVNSPYESVEQFKKIEQSEETKSRIKRNIRVWRVLVWFIVGAHRFTNALKLKKRRKELIQKQKHNIALQYKKEILNLHQKKFQSQTYDWVCSIIGKVVTTLHKGLFLDDFNKMFKLGYENKLFIDFRRSSIVNVSKFMFENMKLASHPSNFPQILQKHMILHLFKGYNKQPSLFVSKRTQYFTKSLNDLNLKEQQMIATEYFLFNVFIPNIIQCFNSQKYYSDYHEIECKMLAKIVISFIQIYFMSLYENMPQLKQMSVNKVVQLNLVEMSGDMRVMELNTVDEVDYKNQYIIKGLFDQSFFTQLIKERKKIQFYLKELMNKITQNISKILAAHIQNQK